MGSHSLLMEGSADIHPSKLRNLPEPSEVDSATDAAEASSSRPDDPRGMSFSLFDVRRSEADATASTKPGRGAGAEAKAKRRRTSGLPAKVASETVPSFVNHGSSPGPGSRNPSAGTPRSHALGQPQAAPTKKVTELMQKAQDTFQKHQDTFTDLGIWGNKIRKRTLDQTVKTLSGLSSQLLAANHEPATDLSCAISSWCDSAEARHSCLTNIRAAPFSYLVEPCVELLEPVQMLSIPMLSNVILFVAAECLKLLDKERCSVLYLFDNYFYYLLIIHFYFYFYCYYNVSSALSLVHESHLDGQSFELSQGQWAKAKI